MVTFDTILNESVFASQMYFNAVGSDKEEKRVNDYIKNQSKVPITLNSLSTHRNLQVKILLREKLVNTCNWCYFLVIHSFYYKYLSFH